MTKRILVIGGAHIDRRGRIDGATVPGASNPGHWFEEAGGGGFNGARNLSRLGHQVTMIAPRGGDALGATVAEAARAAGVEDRPVTWLDRATPSYTAILEKDGNLVIALADMALYALFSPRRLEVRALREAIAASDALVCDANLPAETITALARKAEAQGIPLAGIAISPAKVVRYAGALPHLHILFLNSAEAEAVAGARAERPEDWPALLQARGLRRAVVTAGSGPVMAFEPGRVLRLQPPPVPAIADVTGAGDSFAAGCFSALIGGKPLAEALRQGAAAAAITLASPLATAPELCESLLRDRLALVPEAEILS